MGLDSFRVRGVVTKSDAGLAEEFLEERVHGLKAVGVTGVIAQQDVVLQKEIVVFPAIEKNQAVLAELVVSGEILAKQRAARFCDDVVFHVANDLSHLLSDTADHASAGGLQFGQASFDAVRLLTTFKMFASFADPFLSFEDEVGKLIADLEGQKFQQAKAEQQVDLNVFVVLGLCQSTLQDLGEQLAESGAVWPTRGAQLNSRQIGGAGVLANDVEKILARPLDKFGAQKNVVVDVIHADRQGAHGDRDVIALEFRPRLFSGRKR